MDVAFTRMSSKGQIVIPSEMREDIAEKESFIILRSDDDFILQRVSKLKEEAKKIFENKIEEAWKLYDKGKFKTMSANQFLKELDKWKSNSQKSSKKNTRN